MYQALVRLFYIIHLLLSEFHKYMFIIKSPLGVGEETLTGSTAKALNLDNPINRASDISQKKKQNFAGFSGANSRKNRPISRDFRGKKVKIRGKIGRFRGILAQKSQISKDFQGQSLRKIGRFHGKFQGKTLPRNNQ